MDMSSHHLPGYHKAMYDPSHELSPYRGNLDLLYNDLCHHRLLHISCFAKWCIDYAHLRIWVRPKPITIEFQSPFCIRH
jgi:hypothetical protein